MIIEVTPTIVQPKRRIIAIGRSAASQPFTVASDPLLVRWQAEGAPSCNATWQDEEVEALLPYCEECARNGDGMEIGPCPWCEKLKALPPISERCWECKEAIPPGEEHTVDGHCYHPSCSPGCDDNEYECLSMAVFDALTEPAPNCAECGQLIDGRAHPDGTGNYYCDKCCPDCDNIDFDNIDDSRWCVCLDQYGDGPCPVCGGEFLPF